MFNQHTWTLPILDKDNAVPTLITLRVSMQMICFIPPVTFCSHGWVILLAGKCPVSILSTVPLSPHPSISLYQLKVQIGAQRLYGKLKFIEAFT